MKTHKEKLQALLGYLSIDIEITSHRLMAERLYDIGIDRESWEYLFRWCEAKDQRGELWKWFKDDYPDAIMLKEGYYETR